MNSNITQLKDKNGNNIYPITSSKLVLDEKGQSIEDVVNNHLSNHPQGFSGDYNDLTNKPVIPSKTSQLQNDSGFITRDDIDSSQNHVHTNKSVLDSLTTAKLTEWDNKSNFSGSYSDLTNKPVIPTVDVDKAYVDAELAKKSPIGHNHDTAYASKASEHTHTNKSVIDGITSAKVTEWNSKSTFSGSYNDLTNKPTIPSITGLASETYVNTKVSELVGSAPETLDTLKELSDALGNDPNFATTIANQIGTKADTAYVNTELSKKANTHTHPYKSDSYVPAWTEVTGKPSTFTPSAHSHDDNVRYEVLSGSVVVPPITILSEG